MADWTALLVVVASIAQIWTAVENSPLLRRFLPWLSGMSAKLPAAVFNLCLIALLGIGVVRLGDFAKILDKLSGDFAAWNAGQARSMAAQVTPDNVETNIRKWLDTFSLDVQKKTHTDPAVFFALEVTTPGKNRVTIYRAKPLERYIVLEAAVILGPEHRAMAEKLKSDQSAQVIQDLTREMVRARISNVLYLPLRVVLSNRIPITNGLTEEAFIGRLDEMEFSTTLVRQTIGVSLERFAKSPR